MAALALVTKDFLVVTGNSFRVYCPIHKALSHTDARREPFETRWNLWKRMCFECPPLVKKETADRSENEKESLKMNKKKKFLLVEDFAQFIVAPPVGYTKAHAHSKPLQMFQRERKSFKFRCAVSSSFLRSFSRLYHFHDTTCYVARFDN